MDINSKMKIDKVSLFNPLYIRIGNEDEKKLPEFTIKDDGNIVTSLDGVEKNVHVKFSPLLDPLKYMSGSYDITEELFNIPTCETDKDCNQKVLNPYNSAYVDAMFYSMASKLKTKYRLPHCLDYYGEYNGLKRDLEISLDDDIEYICDCSFFIKNNGDLFTVDCPSLDTPKLKPIVISDTVDIGDFADIDELGLTISYSVLKNETHDNMSTPLDTNDIQLDESSECSSKSSHTDDQDDNESLSSFETESSEESISCNAVLKSFPVRAIYIEKCDDTLDSIMDGLSCDEWESVVFQISVTLYTYQRVFDFTHNDLHTSNIMYVTTDIEFLYYKIMGRHYKIPTHGKIYKIIDFGRAIYKINDKIVYSDSFSEDGDASGQYSFGDIKLCDREVLPNNSFDLCRLGCSIYDILIDDVEAEEDTGIKSMICGWCIDDNGKNILYKRDGTERYPGFKLYKMISRRVNRHTPECVISNVIFEKYMISRKMIRNKKGIINIDDIE